MFKKVIPFNYIIGIQGGVLMNLSDNFEQICAEYSENRNIMFDMDGDPEDNYDCVDTCIVWSGITFYGIPFGLSEKQLDNIYNGDYRAAVKIGKIFGCLILCKQMIDKSNDPLETCDDSNGNLEYTISALSDESGPLNWESGDPAQDVYYIHELKMEPEYDYAPLKSKILKELPYLILSFFHAAPNIIAFYPSPMEYTPDPLQEEREQLLRGIAADKIDSSLGKITGEKSDNEINGNIVKFSDAYKFSEDEIKFVMGRRYSGSSYPEDAKNKDEYSFYEANGFEEMGDSRLLYKCLDKDY